MQPHQGTTVLRRSLDGQPLDGLYSGRERPTHGRLALSRE